MFTLDNKTILVIGLGKTGISIINFAYKNFKNCKIIATDSKPMERLSKEFHAVKKYISVLTLGEHKAEDFTSADIIFVSPGVDLTRLSFAPSFSKDIINDIELAYRVSKINFIGITGSNGKSTTTKLVFEMINSKKRPAVICGNYGNPILDEMMKQENIANFVCELSSFQLENIVEFSPQISLFLNLSEDHLDRYPTFDAYINAKKNIFLNIKSNSIIVYNLDDPLVSEIVKEKTCIKYSFSWTRKGDIYSENNIIYLNNNEFGDLKFSLSRCSLRGKHHIENIMAAILTALTLKTDPAQVQSTIDNFIGIPHRTEFVKEIKGVAFYNDSKATNVGATLKAIESFEKNIILIAGGKDKGGALEELMLPVRQRVKLLFLIGEAKERFYEFFKTTTTCIKCSTFSEAILKSKQMANSGDTVLFSPACSSYDMFKNFEERGNIFKNLVREES